MQIQVKYNGKQKLKTCELFCNIAAKRCCSFSYFPFTPVLQQIMLFQVANSCCREYRTVLLFTTKTEHAARLHAQDKLVLHHWWHSCVWRESRVLFFNQKYLLNLKQPDLLQVGLNVGVKTSNIAFKSPLICRSVAKLVVRILLPFIPYNFKKGKNFINGLKN